ncbi:Gp49 family protein [uncultured Methylobacterium sp.]|jgi:hypothetical protein|uniref:Gp49 family protein n=1 Tax=uncultured Methylobacterium sp. TaxID=157278 RepID=UPI002619468B|nr:Gp49 family protein [uncultured Methylobacterium sp.]
MTTTVTVKVPPDVNYVAQVVAIDAVPGGQDRSFTISVEPGKEQTFYAHSSRMIEVSEKPMDATQVGKVEFTTGLPAITLAEAQAVVETKTAPRITEELMREQIATVDYLKLRNLTICVVTLKNGFFIEGISAAADPANHDAAVGERYAFDNAFRKLWPMFGFLLRDRLSGGETLSALPGLPAPAPMRFEGAASVRVEHPAAA